MPASRADSACSICFWLRARWVFGTSSTTMDAVRMAAPAPVGVAPPTTNTPDTPASAGALATASVLARVSASVAPGGNSSDSTTRLSSCGGMKPVGSSVVDHSDSPNSTSPTSRVT